MRCQRWEEEVVVVGRMSALFIGRQHWMSSFERKMVSSALSMFSLRVPWYRCPVGNWACGPMVLGDIEKAGCHQLICRVGTMRVHGVKQQVCTEEGAW